MLKQEQKILQKQTLNISQDLRRSLEILQMSNAEVNELLVEHSDNLFVELDDITKHSKIEDNKENKINSEDDYAEFDGETFYTSLRRGTLNTIEGDISDNIKDTPSLRDYLLEQINVSGFAQNEKFIAYQLLDLLKLDGYLDVNLDDLANDLKTDIQIIQNILKKLQTFEPVGIFASNLEECLEIQLKDRGLYDDIYGIILEHLDLVACRDVKKLSKLCNQDQLIIKKRILEISNLNPKPSNGFHTEDILYKIPDVILKFDSERNIILSSNDSAIPNITINKEYYDKLQKSVNDDYKKHISKSKNDSEDSKKYIDFIHDEITQANNLLKAIERRKATILCVANAIVQAQIDFFLYGIMHLKPMVLNDIARITGYNESTISRATVCKYIATDSGIYELKYFFSSNIQTKMQTKDGNHTSSTKVKELIRNIISEEGDDVLSDNEIVNMLGKLNVNIARRTVAKYREQMNIATKSVRKSQKLSVKFLD